MKFKRDLVITFRHHEGEDLFPFETLEVPRFNCQPEACFEPTRKSGDCWANAC